MSRRRARWALGLLTLALPCAVRGRRVGEAAGSNQSAAGLPPEAQETLSHAWRVANRYLGHKYVLAFSDMWTIYNNLKKVKDVAGQKRAAAAFVVTGEYFTTLEALQTLDRSLTAALGVRTDGAPYWSCSQYYPDEGSPRLSFRKQSFVPSETFESMNDAACLETLRGQLGMVRWSICHIEAQAVGWAEEMASEDLREFFVDTVRGKSCEGQPLDGRYLDPDFRAPAGSTCVRGKSPTECSQACFKVPECSAMVYDTKRRECCFLGGAVAIAPAGQAAQCFEQVGHRELFLMLDPHGVAKWLSSKGFGDYEDYALSFGGFGLTGIVVAFMTQPMLGKWLELSSAEEARVLRCMVLAELENDPARDCGAAPKKGIVAKAISRSPITSAHIDHGLLWPKGANGKWYSVKWIADFLRRYSPTADAKAWSSMTYDLAAAWLNANGFHRIVSGGAEGLRSPFVLLKAAATSTGLLKFREATAFASCEHVLSQLEPVIQQLRAVPMRQRARVEEALLGA